MSICYSQRFVAAKGVAPSNPNNTCSVKARVLKPHARQKQNTETRKQHTTNKLLEAVHADEVAEIATLLHEDASQTLSSKRALQDKFFLPKPDALAADSSPRTCACMDWVPEHFLVEWLSMDVKVFSQELLDEVGKESETAIRDIPEAPIRTRLHGQLPRECLDKYVLSLVLADRLRCGGRATTQWWRQAYNPTTHALDWTKLDICVVTFVAGNSEGMGTPC